MFKKIKEFFLGKAPEAKVEQAVPYKVESPVLATPVAAAPVVEEVKVEAPAPAPAAVVEEVKVETVTPAPIFKATAVVEFVPAGTEATVATPTEKTKAPVKPKAPAKPKAAAIKAPAKKPAAKKPKAPAQS